MSGIFGNIFYSDRLVPQTKLKQADGTDATTVTNAAYQADSFTMAEYKKILDELGGTRNLKELKDLAILLGSDLDPVTGKFGNAGNEFAKSAGAAYNAFYKAYDTIAKSCMDSTNTYIAAGSSLKDARGKAMQLAKHQMDAETATLKNAHPIVKYGMEKVKSGLSFI